MSTHVVRSKAFSVALSCRPVQSAARSTQPQHPYLGLSPRLPLPSILGPSPPLQAPSTAQLFPLPPGAAPKQSSLPSVPSQVSLHQNPSLTILIAVSSPLHTSLLYVLPSTADTLALCALLLCSLLISLPRTSAPQAQTWCYSQFYAQYPEAHGRNSIS